MKSIVMSRKKIAFIIMCAALLVSSITIYAASANTFSFKMSYGINGTKNYTLKKKSTTVSISGKTLNYATGKTEKKAQGYKVALSKPLKQGSYKSAGTANGSIRIVTFGTISAGKYNVDLSVNYRQPSGILVWYIKGNGKINQ